MVSGHAERGTVGLSGIGGSEHDRVRHVVGRDHRVGRVPCRTKPIDRARHGELGGAEAVDEVPASHLATFFEHLEYAVDGTEPADEPFGHHRLAGHHAVPLDELQRLGMGCFGRRGHRAEQRRNETPAALTRWGANPGETPGSGSTASLRSAGTARLDLRPGEHRSQRGERVVGDLAGPHEVPQRREQLLIGGGCISRADLAPEARALLGELGADRIVQPTLDGFSLLPSRCEQRKLIGETQPHPPVASAERTGAHPDQLAGGAELVEHRRAIRPDANRQHVGLDRGCHECRARQDTEGLDQRLHPTSLGGNVVPGRQEPGKRLLLDRFDLLAQRCQRPAAQLSQHIDIAVLARHAARAELADDQSLLTLQRCERAGDPLGWRTETSGHLGSEERPVSSGVATDDLLERTGDRIGERHRQAERQRAPERVAVLRCVLGRRVPRLAAECDLDDSLLTEQRRQPARAVGPRAAGVVGTRRVAAQFDLVDGEVADAAEHVVQFVGESAPDARR